MADQDSLLRARSHIAAEILSSERAYLEYLQLLQEVYDIPLKQAVSARKPLLTQQEVALVFGRLPPIYTGATAFYHKLDAVRSRASPHPRARTHPARLAPPYTSAFLLTRGTALRCRC